MLEMIAALSINSISRFTNEIEMVSYDDDTFNSRHWIETICIPYAMLLMAMFMWCVLSHTFA